MGSGRVTGGLLSVMLLLGACGSSPAPRAATSLPPSPVPTSPPVVTSAPAPAIAAAPPGPAPFTLAVPAGVNAGVVVFDRVTGAATVRHQETVRFRSASLVKLLIALDYLWERGPAYGVPAADRARLDVMLRSSDDAAATYFWNRAGRREIVSRMVARLGLKDSAPPPANQPGYWGYTALSAADLVLVYRYVLDAAAPQVRDLIMGNLRAATKCGTDRFDQSFGIPGAFPKPWSAKQGWSGFGDVPAQPCVTDAALSADARPGYAETGIFDGRVLHTTGTVGAGDRTIMVVLSQHPGGTSYAKATAALTTLTKSLPVAS